VPYYALLPLATGFRIILTPKVNGFEVPMSKKKPDRKRVAQTSADLTQESIARLREVFPEAVTEGKIDFAKLRESLGDEVDDRPERYSFTWAGKRDAIRLLQTPSRATLVPASKESVNFDETQNIFIEGENLEVLKLLYKSYAGRVKMIYIDPPYNTGNDFIYPDDFRDPLDTYLKLTGQKDSEGNLLTSNPETSGRYHSAWLSMMYPRLFVARQLLREDGVIFVTIDDTEAANLKFLMNEVFGEENFVTSVIWQKKVSPSNDATWFSSDHDQILVFAKNKDVWRPRRLAMNERQKSYYTNPDNDPRGPWNSSTYTCNKSKEQRPNLFYPITNPNTDEKIWPKDTAVWAYSRELYKEHAAQGLIYWGKEGTGRVPRLKIFLSEAGPVVPRTIWPYAEVGSTQEAMRELWDLLPGVGFDTPKPVRLIAHMLKIGTDPSSGDVVLDFFAGSSSTAQGLLELNNADGGNRHFVMVQLPEPTSEKKLNTIAEIGKERIRRVIKKLKDETKGKLDLRDREAPEDLGFRVFKLAESNYRPWKGVENKDGAAYAEAMELFTDPLVPGWKPTNVIYEVALKEGYGLTSTIEQVYPPIAPKNKDEKESAQSAKSADKNVVFRVTDPDKGQSFRISLDDRLKAATVKALALKKDDLFICRDSALTDEMAANLALQCNLKTI
jgi:adenine-specific DNA-methyltransferase